MAMAKFKLAFLALAFACLMQNAAAAPMAGGEKSSLPPELEIIGHALSEIGKSFSEFVKSVVAIIQQSIGIGMTKFSLSIYFKGHIMLTDAGVQDISLLLNEEQSFDYRVLASTFMRLRQKVDVMEPFEEVYDSIIADVTASFFADMSNPSTIPRDPSPAKLFTPLILRLCEIAEKRLMQHPVLREAYLHVRDSVKVQVLNEKPYRVHVTQATAETQSLLQSVPKEINIKMMKNMINKQFLHHTVNRFTILKKEYFLLARSTLELAKKPHKVEMVQKVYDKTLDGVSSYLNPDKIDFLDIWKGLFKELKKNFEANPPLNQDWRDIQKYVGQRHDWDRSIWDLDLLPL